MPSKLTPPTNRFSMLIISRHRIAGTHTTSSTTGLLFYHLLHNPEYLVELVNEIDRKLPPLDGNRLAYSVAEAESSLLFLRNCMRENFRITPVFTMPLERRVLAPGGLVLDGNYIPEGVRPFADHIWASREYLRTVCIVINCYLQSCVPS